MLQNGLQDKKDLEREKNNTPDLIILDDKNQGFKLIKLCLKLSFS